MPKGSPKRKSKGGSANRARKPRELAPSIRLAHQRVRMLWYASFGHSALLLLIALLLFLDGGVGWFLPVLCLVAAPFPPILARIAYRGNSFSALILLVSVVAPFFVAFLQDATLRYTFLLLLLTPLYFVGLKGATGLRGRRGSQRG